MYNTLETDLVLLLLSVNGVVVAVDGDVTDDEKPLLGVVEDVDSLLETVRDDIVLLFVVIVDDVDNDTVVAVVTGITTVLFELTLCDFVGGLRGDGGPCRVHQKRASLILMSMPALTSEIIVDSDWDKVLPLLLSSNNS